MSCYKAIRVGLRSLSQTGGDRVHISAPVRRCLIFLCFTPADVPRTVCKQSQYLYLILFIYA